MSKANEKEETFEKIPRLTYILSVFSFYLLLIVGRINNYLFSYNDEVEVTKRGYPSVLDNFEIFYIKYVYRRMRQCLNYPVVSVPGKYITIKERVTYDNGWTFNYTGKELTCLNLGSYNYLGFSENKGVCAESSKQILQVYGVNMLSTPKNYGTLKLHQELEKLVAEFIGVEDSIVFGMGFATNTMNLPAIFNSDCLVISDEKNHASLIVGIKLSRATCKVFKHNNMQHLEEVLIKCFNSGRKNAKFWSKIFVVVEGVYSMEGSICPLPKLIELKKKYKFYIYLDEAHSIGALGRRGRGVCDYYNCNPKDVDILMGTFTKSFGSAGGYIAGSKDLINYIRAYSHSFNYSLSMSPPIAQQIMSSMKIIMGLDGTDEGECRLSQLHSNVRYFHLRLKQMGLVVYGHIDSPIKPIVVYFFSKIRDSMTKLFVENIATVGVGYPATPLYESRLRICLCATHTKEELDKALIAIENISKDIGLDYSKLPRKKGMIKYENIN